MRHLALLAVVFLAIFSCGWAQNRGSSRYAPADYDGDVTRATRAPPTRVVPIRRGRPTKAPEPQVIDEEHQVYQPQELPVRTGTTARRAPTRNAVQPVPQPIAAENPVPLYPAVGEEILDKPAASPEGKPQGRRRRPKKRRRPQASAKPIEELEKPNAAVSENDKVPITDLINDDRKRPLEYHSNPQSRNVPSSINSDPAFQPDEALWTNGKLDGNAAIPSQTNTRDSQYFRPQAATNRLPVDDAPVVEDSRRFAEPSPNAEITNTRYIPVEPEVPVPNRASYVPVLPPIRVPTQDRSRLPHEEAAGQGEKSSVRHGVPVNRGNIQRGNAGRPSTRPLLDPSEILKNTGAKPTQNVIPQGDVPQSSTRGQSEVRLPEKEQPILVPEYSPSNYDSHEEIFDQLRQNEKPHDEDRNEPIGPTNRLPNPSEVHYESVYPSYLNENPTDPQFVARDHPEPAIPLRREEQPSSRNLASTYNSRSAASTRPRDYDNDAETDKHQPSQYQPPLQRTGSRYRPEEDIVSTRSRGTTVVQPQETPKPTARARGSSRYQASDVGDVVRTRGSSRHQADGPTDLDNRARTTNRSPSPVPNIEAPPTRTRSRQRYQADSEENGSRVSSRRQTNPETHRNVDYQSGAPLYTENDAALQDVRRSRQPVRTSHRAPVPAVPVKEESEPSAAIPQRNTLRSRPQYDVPRDVGALPYGDQFDNHQSPPAYEPDYQAPRQQYPRENSNRRAPPPREHQPEYREPQNPRTDSEQHNSREQPQYQAPQNPRVDRNQPSSRQRQSSQPQTRPRHPEPHQAKPPTARSHGGSRFSCPDAFGFFADPVQCDKYYECRNGTAEEHLCNDGLAFNEISSPKFLRCDSLRDVDCTKRPELQEARPTKNCPRRFGLFPHETDCTKFWNCVDGASTEVQCPPGLTYNDALGTCDWADLVKSSCKTEDLLGFTCPEGTAHDLLDGVFTRYPHPDNCQLHYTCIKGDDGQRRPRLLSCNEGLVYNSATQFCARPDDVPGCEDFYGVRSPPPKRKATRQPAPREPEEEEYEEAPPTPRPRRRGSNRRTRN